MGEHRTMQIFSINIKQSLNIMEHKPMPNRSTKAPDLTLVSAIFQSGRYEHVTVNEVW